VAADLSPHLDGLATGELRVSRCRMCGAAQFPPRAVCGSCSAEDATEWITAAGHGTVWSFAVFRKAYLPDHPPPYVVAVVELVEGITVISNIVGAELGALRVGQSVRAEFDTGLDPALARVLFRPEPPRGGLR
jgi:uncharacterized OB-fold protein